VKTLAEEYNNDLRLQIESEFDGIKCKEITKEMLTDTYRSVGWFKECGLLMKRVILDARRNPLYIRTRIIQTLIIALLTLS